MPKKLRVESAVHQLLAAGRRLQAERRCAAPAEAKQLADWLNALQFDRSGAGELRIAWSAPCAGEHAIDLKRPRFYTRGDTPSHAQAQAAQGWLDTDDHVMAANAQFFDAEIRRAACAAGLPVSAGATARSCDDDAGRKANEQAFHDGWAANEDLSSINVRKRNEACTAPEMRFLRGELGDLKGKQLLDVGCGLGEASVYFALEGAHVLATDVSPGMCDAARQLADLNGTSIETRVSAAEDLALGSRQFDIIYTGNTLHHADIRTTLDGLLKYLKPNGVFVSWDPVAYNPIINVYRRVATKVRTPDEHPLRLRDIREITSRFETARVRWFWLTALLIFIWMAIMQRRSPNRERFWKTVIDEADKWDKVHRPLERLDRLLLAVFPFLGPLCWNVAIVGRSPRHGRLPSDV